jgi:hypothetical protein
MSEIPNCSAKDSAFFKKAPKIMPENESAVEKRAAEQNHSNANIEVCVKDRSKRG